ncbi:hypothetical protein BGY98DRAFT_996471 [Russula aff. rugulosa BPL654]|jgi:hypothetical protein|nr:hypothetical protein BGY98DRAFT_996471 [Russula aff. rugulosa BPL654]
MPVISRSGHLNLISRSSDGSISVSRVLLSSLYLRHASAPDDSLVLTAELALSLRRVSLWLVIEDIGAHTLSVSIIVPMPCPVSESDGMRCVEYPVQSSFICRIASRISCGHSLPRLGRQWPKFLFLDVQTLCCCRCHLRLLLHRKAENLIVTAP